MGVEGLLVSIPGRGVNPWHDVQIVFSLLYFIHVDYLTRLDQPDIVNVNVILLRSLHPNSI